MNTRSLQDALAKLNAKSGIGFGGTQYTSDVGMAVRGINKGKAMMRNQKKPLQPISLNKFRSYK